MEKNKGTPTSVNRKLMKKYWRWRNTITCEAAGSASDQDPCGLGKLIRFFYRT